MPKIVSDLRVHLLTCGLKVVLKQTAFSALEGFVALNHFTVNSQVKYLNLNVLFVWSCNLFNVNHNIKVFTNF